MNAQHNHTPKPERRGPPLPEFMFKLINPMMKALLNSPFHGGVSKNLLLLTFTGRKSGKIFTTPVGYVRQGGSLTVLTHSAWWKNLIGGVPVSVRIQGKNVTGVGSPLDDPLEIKSAVRDLIAANGETRARQLGYWVEDLDASPQAIQQAVAGTIFIRIRLDAQ